ncbi:Isa1 [Kluyveromyces lactis]|nr:Isa1 [Kluyveromyces lactis]
MQRHILSRSNQYLLRGNVLAVRHLSQRPLTRTKRFLQTSQNGDKVNAPVWPFNFEIPVKNSKSSAPGTQEEASGSGTAGAKKTWLTYSLPKNVAKKGEPLQTQPPKVDENIQPKKRTKRKLRPRKALISLTPNALSHLKGLLDQPEPKLIRIGVKNRGCSGLTYDLQYITSPGKFDEVVEQDGVKVIIDSKALFSIVGSEMDWVDDKLSSRFVFKNPNSKGTCGCGESFMV